MCFFIHWDSIFKSLLGFSSSSGISECPHLDPRFPSSVGPLDRGSLKLEGKDKTEAQVGNTQYQGGQRGADGERGGETWKRMKGLEPEGASSAPRLGACPPPIQVK